MDLTQLLSAIVLGLLVSIQNAYSESLGRGFNDDIEWMGMEDGLAEAKETNKPIMVLIHKTWCGACKALKPEFAKSKEIEDLSGNFVMVNIQDDEEESLPKEFSEAGKYIPRILFMESDGKLRPDIKNSGGNDKYPYFYSGPSQIVAGMKESLKKLTQGNRVSDGGEL